MGRLKSEARGLVGALGDRALSSVRDKVEGATGRLTEYVEGGAGPGIMAAVTGARGLAEGKSPLRSALGAGMAGLKEKVAGMFGKGGKGGGGKKLKLTNIVESIDVGVPIKLAYNQWTQFSDFPRFMKKVENVDQPEEQRTTWKAQIFWSHRTWDSTVLEQVPDDKIVWRSKGQKGRVDGAVTFHELAPNLTRILLVLEYHPQGLFERTGNIWHAQGRRARLELKHFRRHVMTEGLLKPDDIEGWRGTIQDGEVVQSHEDAIAREQQDGGQRDGSRQAGDGQAEGAAQDRVEDGEAAADEHAELADEHAELADAHEEDENQGAEDDNGRRARAEDDNGRRARAEDDNGRRARAEEGSGPSSRSRRSSGTRSSGASGGNGRRQRAGAATQRGGST
jgi:uncharacterized membrane protein